MFEFICMLLHHILALIFGVAVSASFLAIPANKRNIFYLSLFCIAELVLQGSLYFLWDISAVLKAYPLITHFPLFLFMMFVFHRNAFASLIAITTAYLCCQICNWASMIPDSLHMQPWVSHLTYSLVLIITFFVVLMFISPAISALLQKSGKALFSFSIIPVFYYLFDYLSTVYTSLLYTGTKITVEFVPFLLCISYLIFCAVYFKQYEEKQSIENLNRLMLMEQEQSEREFETFRRNEKATALLRHDMRHFLTTVSSMLENGESENAIHYIHELIENSDKVTNKRYCSNHTMNTILSFYAHIIEENEIQFHYTVQLEQNLSISDTDITSILSNALENAIHALKKLPVQKRILELSITEKCGKLLFSISNTCKTPPKMKDDIPVSDKEGHGFGTQSILYTVKKLNGNCQFSYEKERFLLRIVL